MLRPSGAYKSNVGIDRSTCERLVAAPTENGCVQALKNGMLRRRVLPDTKHRRGDGPSGGVVLPYFTVSLTALVYTLPALFFTRHLYLYPFHFLAALKEYEAFVALLIFSHFLAPGFSRYH